MPIDIHVFPFHHASPKPGSGFVAELVMEMSMSPLMDVTSGWRVAEVPFTAKGKVTNNVKNRDEVKKAVTALALRTAGSQWRGKSTLALGGDHSQGFATIKATLLVSVVRAIQSGEIPLEADQKDAILSMAHKGSWQTADEEISWQLIADKLDELVDNNVVKQSQISNVTDRYTVMWVDAHGDSNDHNTSPSKNFHGMSLAAACGCPAGGIENVLGKCIRMNPKNVYVIGARDLDLAERDLMKQLGIQFEDYDMHDLKHPKIRTSIDGEGKSLKEVLDSIIKDADKVILSFDLDSLQDVPGTGTYLNHDIDPNIRRLNVNEEAPNGICVADAIAAVQGVAQNPKIAAIDLTEFGYNIGSIQNPVSDDGITIHTGMKILFAMLGKKQDLVDEVFGDYQKVIQESIDLFMDRPVRQRTQRGIDVMAALAALNGP